MHFFSSVCGFHFIGPFPKKLAAKEGFSGQFGPEVKFSGWNMGWYVAGIMCLLMAVVCLYG